MTQKANPFSQFLLYFHLFCQPFYIYFRSRATARKQQNGQAAMPRPFIYMSKANCLGTADSRNFDMIRDLVESCSRDAPASLTSAELKTPRYACKERQAAVMRLVSLYKAGLSSFAVSACPQRYALIKQAFSGYRQNPTKNGHYYHIR